MSIVSHNANYETFVFLLITHVFQPSSVFKHHTTGLSLDVPAAGYAYFRRAVTKSLETRFCAEFHLAPGPETWRLSRDGFAVGFLASQGFEERPVLLKGEQRTKTCESKQRIPHIDLH